MVLWKPFPTAKMSLAALQVPNDTSLGDVRTIGPVQVRNGPTVWSEACGSSYHISCAELYGQVRYVHYKCSILWLIRQHRYLDRILEWLPFHNLVHDARNGPGTSRSGEAYLLYRARTRMANNVTRMKCAFAKTNACATRELSDGDFTLSILARRGHSAKQFAISLW